MPAISLFGGALVLLLVRLALAPRRLAGRLPRQALRPMSTFVSPQPPARRALPQARPGPAKPPLSRAAVASRQAGGGGAPPETSAKVWACGGEMRQAGWGGGEAGQGTPGLGFWGAWLGKPGTSQCAGALRDATSAHEDKRWRGCPWPGA